MATRMLQRRGTAAEWASANPIQGEGEIGEELDTHMMKIGDGVTHWNDLPYANISPLLFNAKGDIIVASADNVATILSAGADGDVLTVQPDGSLAWETPSADLPLSTFVAAGDIAVATGAGTAGRLAKGANGSVLTVVGGALTWAAPSADVPLSTVTAAGDLIQGSGAGAVSRLAKGANGTFLSVVAGVLTWANQSADVPLSTVTTAGDLIVGSGAAAVARLGKGAAGQMLQMVSGSVAWADSPDIPKSTLTTKGDLISSGGSGPIRIARGATGQVLTVDGSGGLSWTSLGGIVVCTNATRPASPTAGLGIYETDTNKFYIYNGTTWVQVPTDNQPATFLELNNGNGAHSYQTGSFTMALASGLAPSTAVTFPTSFLNAPVTMLTAGLITGNTPGVIVNSAGSTTSQVTYMARQYTGTFTGSVPGFYTAIS